MFFFSLAMIAQLEAMEECAWDIERIATQIGNQRRADDKVLIKEYQMILSKNYKDLSHEEKCKFRTLAGKYETFCILELACKSPLFKDQEMALTKDLMLYDAVHTVATGGANSKRRARVLKNVELLLQHGAAQNESRFKSVIGDYYIFNVCGVTKKDFKVGEITENDHLQLIGLFAKYVTHDAFKKSLEEQLLKTKDHDWALKIAEVAITNGMDSARVNAILKQRMS